jgi:hypothetical protein
MTYGGGNMRLVIVQRETKEKQEARRMYKDEQRCLHPQEASLDACGLI